MNNTSEVLFALKPVTFRYKKQIAPMQALSFGLIAEEVAEINPELITRDKDGKPDTVRYEAVNAMLLNEFLKEHKIVEEQNRKLENQDTKIQRQESVIAELKKDVETLVARIEEQASVIERVSEQIEANKAAPQFARSDR